jgi:protein TonB
MINPTPSSETGIVLAPQPVFAWTFSGAPIRVNLPLALISRLRDEITQLENADKNGTRAEAGGVLMGYQNKPASLEISDYRWVLSERRQDGRFTVDPDVLKRLRPERGAPAATPQAQLQVVGYFRTQAGGALRLRSDELAFVREHFPDPSNVVLLVQTAAKPYTAGFFFWMETNVFAPFSLMNFPLEADVLGLQKKPAQASERSVSVPVTSLAPVKSPEIAAALPQEAAESAQPQTEPAEIEPAGIGEPRLRPVFPSFRLITLLGLVVLFFGGVAIYQFQGQRTTESARTAPAPAVKSPLQLEVEEQGRGLNVRWNPQSEAILQAREANLEIQEDNQAPQITPLDAQQLSSGHVYYRSSGERLQFRLEVRDDAGKVTRESVLALSGKARAPDGPPTPPPNAAPVPAPAAAKPSPPAGRTTDPLSASRNANPTKAAAAVPIPVASPVTPVNRARPRVFSPPVRGAPVATLSLNIDQPAAVANTPSLPGVAAPGTLSGLPAPVVNRPPVGQAPPTQPPPSQPAISPSTSPKPLVVGGTVQAANLITRVAPVYPQTAMLAHIQGTVRFTALIGKDGAVRNLQTIGGNAMLVPAAADAVRQWKYRPTLLDGEPIEVVTQIDVNFTLNR